MKNFRKVLALVLVVATLFSFVAMTASAKTYTDGDKVSYTEAVDVLSAIGILNGYNDGSFKPTQTIKRSEMAKMIAVLANEGKDDIGEIYASACKFADMNGDAAWAKSYVAYCNQIGIVAGRNATTFDPTGKVTGIETAKMLLCMIGFDAKAQGYVGTNWKVNVLRDAEKVGLLEGFAADFEADKAITREEAANMMLNALLAPMVVGTVSDSIVTISNTVWLELNGFKTTIKTITLTDAIDVYNCYILYGNVLVSNIPVWTNYAGLKVDADARDCYGNPVTKWSYTNAYGKEVWTAEYAQTPDYYYTDTATLKTDLAKLGDNVQYAEYYVDGAKTNFNKSLDDLIDLAEDASGRGVEVKVYIQTKVTPATNAANPAKISNKVIVTVKNTYIGVVDEVVKAAGTFEVNGRTFSNAGYGFAEGDMILYWICDHDHDDTADDLHTAEIATPVNVDLTRTYVSSVDAHDSYIVGSSKTYYYAKNFGKTITPGNTYLNNANNLEDGTYDLYLDKFGNIMGWKYVPTSVEEGYMYLVEGTGVYDKTGSTSSGNKLYTATADTVDFAAKYTENDKIGENAFTALREAETGEPIDGSGYSQVKHGLLVHYYVNAKGEKEVLNTTVGGGIAYQVDEQGVVLNKNGNLVGANGKVDVYGDDATKYLVRTYDYATGEFKYTAYDWKGLPYNFVGKLDSIDDAGKNDKVVANIQYFTEKNTAGYDVLTYVFVNSLYTDSTPVNVFVVKKLAHVSDDLFNTVLNGYDAYEAVVGGKEGILAVNPSTGDKVQVGYYLNKAELTVIGLTDNDVPVYADVEGDLPDTVGGVDRNAWYYEGSKLWLYDNGSNVDAPKGGYFIADNFFAVIAYQQEDGSYKYEVVTDPKEVNDYVEIKNGTVNVGIPTGYMDMTSWAEFDGGYITELYIKVNNRNA